MINLDKKNTGIFKMKNLYEKILILVKNNELRNQIALNAYKTIFELWNAEVAAKRLIQLIDGLGDKIQSSSWLLNK